MEHKPLDQVTIQEFLTLLSSKAPAPGGGGVAALTGAQGMALASMVCQLTMGKKKFLPYDAELKKIQAQAEQDTFRWMEMIEEDKINFEPLSRAYSLPSETSEEKEKKTQIMEHALQVASRVPISAIEMGLEGIRLHQQLLPISSKLVISDIGVGVQCLQTAMRSAELNAVINLRLMNDKAYAKQERQRLQFIIEEAGNLADTILEEVNGYLGV